MTEIVNNGIYTGCSLEVGLQIVKNALARHTLSPANITSRQNFQEFIPNDKRLQDYAGHTMYFITFLQHDHTINLFTDDKALIVELNKLIRANQKTPEYIGYREAMRNER